MITFDEMGLYPELLKGVIDLGFEKPTPIQEKIIPAVLSSKTDIIALAQTGTGKTASFGLPLINEIDLESKKVQALVLCPTRELCMQITSDLKNYAKFINGFRATPVYGGAQIAPQIDSLKKGSQIVVGTPGRTLDLIKRKVLRLSEIRWLVLDEADEMLNMGFEEELTEILAVTPEEKQTLLFSATMPETMSKIARKHLMQPVEYSVGKRNTGAENVRHFYYMAYARDRYNALKRIADINPNIYGIVFCRTRQTTKEIAEKLMADGYNADALHGDLSQPQRDYVMNRFRAKNLNILVATDVAARGLDVNDLTHIINYHLPDDPEAYIHRSGRTGRAGKSGISISIIHSKEVNRIKALEKISGKKFEKKLIPEGREICEKQLFSLIDKVEKVEVDTSQIEDYMSLIYKKLSWLERDELIKRFVSVEFNKFLSYYKDAPDLNVSAQDKPVRVRDRKMKFSRFYISIGLKEGLDAPKLIGLINDQTKTRDIVIGKIDIMRKFSFFEIDISFENLLIKSFRNASYHGIPVNVEISKPDVKKGGKGHYSESKRSSSDKRKRSDFGKNKAGDYRKKNSGRKKKKY